MEATLEQRLSEVEKRLAALERAREMPPLKKDPMSTFGHAKNDPYYEAAAKAGEEYRRSQTYEKEIENGGGSGH